MKIDQYIKPLVDEFNKLEGITTTDSCEGHSEDDETYIAFVVKDLLSLNSIGNRISVVFAELYYKIPKNTTFTGSLEYHTRFENNKALPSFSFQFITNNLKWRHECIAFFIKRFREIREKHGIKATNVQLGERELVKKLIEEDTSHELKELEKYNIIEIIDKNQVKLNPDFLKKVNTYGRTTTQGTSEDRLFDAVVLTLQSYQMEKNDLIHHACRLTNLMMGKRPSPHREK